MACSDNRRRQMADSQTIFERCAWGIILTILFLLIGATISDMIADAIDVELKMDDEKTAAHVGRMK